jgi:hypothetical protein
MRAEATPSFGRLCPGHDEGSAPDGQIGGSPVQSPSQKYSGSLLTQITSTSSAVPSHSKGRLAIVTNAGRDAMDAGGAEDEGAYLAYGEAVWS